MLSSRRGYLWLLLLLIVGMGCGEDPVQPETIENGTDVLESSTGEEADYGFDTSLSYISGFSLYVLNGSPILTAESGLAEESGDIAPDPASASFPRGLYPTSQQPDVGDQFYLFVDYGDNRYFARILITRVDSSASSNFARVSFNWDFNTNPGDRNF